ncbi:MAG TPA: endolytic transglycosylase MltG [Candidatus Paceibacterota bacterium]|nr:endolytic transglycosylase MltG [Candidatus Paceibacterota bacterium]
MERRHAIRRGKRTMTVVAVSLLSFAFVLWGVATFMLGGTNVRYEGVNASLTNASAFPVGVDPREKRIVEVPNLDAYIEREGFAATRASSRQLTWVSRVMGQLALMDWFQNLASLSSRTLVIEPGERGEEVADHFAKILGWSEDERAAFVRAVAQRTPAIREGKFYPGRYTVPRDASPEAVADAVLGSFTENVLSRYATSTAAAVPLQDALTIASLLEREAYDFDDMRLIAGVIWNRLFIGMNLQIDATLQYAKGTKPSEPWWPQVGPADKYIESAYNTYENPGLPPAPIANPSAEAILAALNPKNTDCLYYFHDKKAGFHCAATYDEHVDLLKRYYGRGK